MEMSEMMRQRRIAIMVCLEPLVQAGVQASLAGEADMQVLAGDVDSVCQRVDVVIADYATAIDMVRNRRRVGCRAGLQFSRILIVSAQVHEHAVRSAMEQGIHGMVLTGSPVCDLLAAIRSLSRGDKYLCPELARQLYQFSAQDMRKPPSPLEDGTSSDAQTGQASRARHVREPHLATDTAICFGRSCLMVRQRRLEHDGAPISIGDRALDLLIVLVECAGTVVSKRDLMARVWPHVIVDEVNLRVQVAGLRKALGEQCIATVQGRGYAFVASLRLRRLATPARSQAPDSRWRGTVCTDRLGPGSMIASPAPDRPA